MKEANQMNQQGPSAVIFLDSAPQNAVATAGTNPQIVRDESLTLRSLIDSYGVTSVVECDDKGQVMPRTVILDQPTDKLHRGTYYTTRKRARETGDVAASEGRDDVPASQQIEKRSAVHFSTRVAVKEFPVSLHHEGDHSHGAQNEGRHSMDLLADSLPMASHRKSSEKKKICFKTFFHVSPTTGKSTLVTLDYFNQMLSGMGAVQSNRNDAAARHQKAEDLFREADILIATARRRVQITEQN